MFSSGNLNESTVSSPNENFNNIRLRDADGQEDESSTWNAGRKYLSESILTVGVDMNVKYLPLIHQDPNGWAFISKSLRLMAAGKVKLDVVWYLIETFLEEFSVAKGFNVEILKKYFDSLNNSEKNAHQAIFCELARLILKTPELFPNSVNLLIPNGYEKMDLSRTQCLCLVAHMFMCTSLPPYEQRVVNFGHIFHKAANAEKTTESVQINKIKCLMNYFAQALKEQGERTVVFERIVAEQVQSNQHGDFYKIADKECCLEAWRTCTDRLTEFSYIKDGKMVGGSKTIEIAFSSRAFGGQTLKLSPTQQEMIILQSPECLLGCMLFPGQLSNGEAFCITGARQFNKCDGIEDSFEFKSDFKEDSSEFSKKKISFIDAFSFRWQGTSLMQFSPQGIQRETTKAFIGFAPYERDERTISTGGWGTGFYKGNIYSKFLFQWMAASRANRKMEFYAYGNKKLGDLIDKLRKNYEGKTIGELMRDLLICAEKAPQENNSNYDLFTAMKNEFNWR